MPEISSKNSEIVFEGAKYISLAQASLGTPYSQEYLSLLARRGVLDSRKFGRTWYITPSALATYVEAQRRRIEATRSSDSFADSGVSESVALPTAASLAVASTIPAATRSPLSLLARVFAVAWLAVAGTFVQGQVKNLEGLANLIVAVDPAILEKDLPTPPALPVQVASIASFVDSLSTYLDLSTYLQWPASAPDIADIGTPIPSPASNNVVVVSGGSGPTRSQLLSAVQDFFSRALPTSLVDQLRGPQGAAGPEGMQGVQGPAGYSIGSVPQVISGGSVGSIGGVTYFGAKDLSTQTLSVSGSSTLASVLAESLSVSNTFSVGGSTFLATTSVSGNFEVTGAASASATFGSGLTDCDTPSASVLFWDATTGRFSCGIESSGGAGALNVREFGVFDDIAVATISFNAAHFSLAASGSEDVSVSLDWTNGPASRAMANTWSALNVFSAGASLSTNLEVGGYASISKQVTIGGGLSGTTKALVVNNGSSTGNIFEAQDNGTAVFTVEDGGNVGIGISNPIGLLDILHASGRRIYVADNNDALVWTSSTTNATASGIGLVAGSDYNGTGLKLTGASDALGNTSQFQYYAGGSQRSVWTTTGFRFGDGTLPSAKFEVGGVTGTTKALVVSNGSSTGNIFEAQDNGTAVFTVFDGGSASLSSNFEIRGTASVSGTVYLGGSGATISSIASTSTVVIQNGQFGALQFDQDGGIMTAFELPVTSAATSGTVQSYTSNIDGSPVLTIYGKSDGSGGVTNLGVGIRTTAPTAALEIQGTASASYFLTGGTMQIGGYSSASYSRFGTTATTHSLAAASDLMIGGLFEVDGKTFLDGTASLSSNLEIGGTASISGSIYLGGSSATISSIASTSQVVIQNGLFGAMNFETDAGMISMFDLPVASASSGTVQSYTANIDGTPILTVYSEADGSGGIKKPFVGIRTTAPTTVLEVQGTASASYFLTGGTMQIGGYSSVSYNRIGTSTTAHSNYISTSSDLLVSGDLEVRASLSIGGTASVSGNIFTGTGYLLSGATTLNLNATTPKTTHTLDFNGYNGTVTLANSTIFGNILTATNAGALSIYGATGQRIGIAATTGTVTIGAPATPGKALIVNNGTSTGNIFEAQDNGTAVFTVYDGGTASLSGAFEVGGYASVSSTLYLAGNAITGTASTSSIAIPNLEVGATEFAANSGIVSWIDMAISSASRDTVESYTAQLDGNPMLTIFAKSDGSGGIRQSRVGLGTLSPWAPFSMIASDSHSTTASTSFAIRSSATIGSVASISAVSLIDGGVVMRFTVPASTSAAAGYLLVKDTAGAIYASLGYGGRLSIARDIRSDGAVSTCTAVNTPSAGCIDYAESFPSADSSLVAGDIVAINPASASTVVKAQATSSVIGVVSTNPGILITGYGVLSGSSTREAPANTVPIALAGRVPVKISEENGAIVAGDHLTISATIPGVAMKQTAPGISIGVALDRVGLPEDRVMVVVDTSYWAPSMAEVVEGASQLPTTNWLSWSFETLFAQIVATFSSLMNTTFGDGQITTKKICLDDICIDKAQLQQLLENQGMTPSTPDPTPEATPTPDSEPESTPEATPTPETEPEETPTPEVTPEPEPSPTPEPTPESTPEITPEP